jgi:serine/threonine-protein kinase TNNI3K
MVTEYMSGGTLFSLLHNPDATLSWRQVVDMLIDISKGMCYLHGWRPRPILHRDLKSLNLLYDSSSRMVKISDFGIARPYDTVQYRHLRGSWHWLAPEVYVGEVYSTAADVYSFAICAWEVCTRQAPFPNEPPESVPYRARHEGRRPEIPSWVPPPLSQLIQVAWTQDPAQRPGFDAILAQLNSIKSQMEASDAAALDSRRS